MKTLIVGTGIIGAIYGWALSESGADVTHLARPGRAAALAEGLRLDVLDERKGHPANLVTRYAARCVESVRPEDGYELVIFPVNCDQLVEALREVAPKVNPETVFLTFTANWDGTREIEEAIGDRPYLMGYPDGGGTNLDGLYWVNLGAEVHLGATQPKFAERLPAVQALFERADMKPDIQPDMLKWLWVHNASAVGFAAGYARYGAVKPFLKDGELLNTCVEATRELLAICEKRGARVKDYPEVGFMGWPTWIVVTLMRWMWTTNTSMQRYTAHAASAGSVRETRANYLSMRRSARELGVDTPAFDRLGKCLGV